MKKDHNLDDLIIDDIKPARNKGKGLLTIIALLIILLIVAIVMTRLFLGESDQNNTIAEQSQEELISPELKLDTSEHDAEADKRELEQLSSMMEETLTDEKGESQKASQPQSSEKKPVTKEPTATKSAPQEPKAEEIAPETTVVSEEPKPVRKPVVIETAEKPVQKPTPQTHPAPKPKPSAAAKKPVARSGSYFIQVGSFSQRPSSQFLSVIRKNGFHYVLKGGKLLIGPYKSDAAARSDLPRVKSKINKGAFIKHL